jgi:hypothetical protein
MSRSAFMALTMLDASKKYLDWYSEYGGRGDPKYSRIAIIRVVFSITTNFEIVMQSMKSRMTL